MKPVEKMEYKGLTEKEAAKILSEYGRNELKEIKKESLLKKFINQFKQFMVILLIIAAIVAAFLGEIVDSVMIFIIVIQKV